MIIACIRDLHGFYPKLEGGDLASTCFVNASVVDENYRPIHKIQRITI